MLNKQLRKQLSKIKQFKATLAQHVNKN